MISTKRETIRIGVDLGGTKIEVIALTSTGEEVFRHRMVAPRGSYHATIRAIQDLVQLADRITGSHGTVGVGIPGAMSNRNGLIKNANSTWIIGYPLLRDLRNALGRPVKISNDANCFAVSEAVDGAGEGCEVVFGVILGTGVGAGITFSGRPLEGANSIAGEWGHNPLPWSTEDERPGDKCYCGRSGCIETFLSGPALERAHSRVSGENLSSVNVAKRAADGDRAAQRSMATYEERLAKSLAHVINILDPDVIILGGGISNISRLYENVPSIWGQYVFSDRIDTPLLSPVHGDSSGVRGAAWLWPSATIDGET